MGDSLGISRVRIQKVEASDALRTTDTLRILCDRLRDHEHYYPSIKQWVSAKVVPDLKTGRRVGFVGLDGDKPVLAAVLKHGPRSKFCHLSIESSFQGSKLGHLMFSLMAAEVRHAAEEIHFTLPEGLWEREKGFFQVFGFASAEAASSQYRLFEEELRCSAPFSKVWSCVLEQLPTLLTSTSIAGFQVNEGVVLSLQARHAAAVMQGRKTVELRKRFTGRWIGRSASVYAAGGPGSLLGTVTIGDVVKGDPEEIWDRFGSRMSCTRSEYDEYVGDRHALFAIELSDPRPYESPVPLSQLSHLLGEVLHPPQSYSSYSCNDAWGKALSLAAMLHAKFSGDLPTFSPRR
jgi:predicted transcriptional regulator